MPTQKRQSRPLSAHIRHIGRVNLVIVAAFALVFVGFGSTFVYRSQASGDCVLYKLSYGRFPYSICNKQIQYALQKLKMGSTCPTGKCDGLYGYVTQAAVLNFGNYTGIPGGNGGQVGARTWNKFCAAGWEYPVAADTMGCNSGIPYSQWGTR